MISTVIDVAGIGPVTFSKRRGCRSIRLSVSSQTVKVTLPYWVPYAAAETFVLAKTSWIKGHLASQSPSILQPNQAIGKAHHLTFISGEQLSGRLQGTVIKISLPSAMDYTHDEAQATARQAVVRALRKQAQQLLPPRVRTLAGKHNFQYSSIAVKQLKRRWGSCDQHRNLVFNLYLMQLPWELIDYVILHELTHTRHLNHSPAFWEALQAVLPEAKNLRRQLRQLQPLLQFEA